MTKQDKQKYIQILNDKKATLPCARCGNTNFSILDGYFRHEVQQKLDGNISFGGAHIPCLAVACENCGNISMHALGALGLLPQGEKLND